MRVSRTVTVLLLAAAFVGGCSSPAAQEGHGRTPEATASRAAPTGSTATGGPRVDGLRTLAGNLAVPWGIAFLPGGDALVTERDSARLLRVTPGGEVTEVGKIPDVRPGGEGGLMGVAVDPDYDENQYIFLYFTAESDNRIVRYKYGTGLSGEKVIVTGIPKAGIHDGGRLAFGPDGYLYASTGEAGQPPQAQKKDDLGGKILRMDADGEPASGNPFGTLVWSYGHRNVQGLAWDEDDRMFASEFGADSFDEVNLIKKGRNYGWPVIEGAGGPKRFEQPLLTWSTDEASPSGAAYAGGSLWVAGLRGERLWEVPLNEGEAGKPVAHLTGELGRLRGVATAPDGSLWLSTSNKDGRGDPAENDDRIMVIPPR